ncbi:serpin family protein [Nakamurella aerolata]|uniref:Serpin domain-containing protein n=1 Tax=Nakamurella aerolata TaxID=1656892 RepID=A0A849AAH7_9ACTN|nr:serpin family protein [Nakamurella aerolata]NNG37519.1 hypothetical protein [Nakamurella aerolata]
MSHPPVPTALAGRAVSRRALLALLAAGGAGLLTACERDQLGRAEPAAGSLAAMPSGSGDGGGIRELRGAGSRVAPAGMTMLRLRFGAFSSALLAATQPDDKGNTLISPYSLLAAIGMADFGATGAPAEALKRGLSGSADEVASWITAIDAAVAAAVADSQDVQAGGQQLDPMVVQTANSLFLQQDYRLRREFLDALARGYDAPVRTVDFRGDADGARSAINTWVGERTRGLIPELLDPARVTELTRLVLVNALYLKAPWAAGPAAEDTHDFAVGGKQRLPVPWLSMDTQTIPYATGDGWSAASIGLGGGGLAMTIVLPDKADTDPVTLLRPEVWTLPSTAPATKVKVQLPRLELDSSTDMVPALSAMGMAGAFNVPLTGMGEPGQEPLLITAIIHKVKFTSDDQGIEAAAATAVVAPGGAAPGPPEKAPVEFVVDRPFLFVVHDVETGMPLFTGAISDPR